MVAPPSSLIPHRSSLISAVAGHRLLTRPQTEQRMRLQQTGILIADDPAVLTRAAENRYPPIRCTCGSYGAVESGLSGGSAAA